MESYESAVPFEPSDLHDLTEIALRDSSGQVQTWHDTEVLQKVTRLFSSARKIKGSSACPFYDSLYFTRTDGVKGFLNPATDSCNMVQADGGCYEYGESDEACRELWQLLGLWSEGRPRF